MKIIMLIMHVLFGCGTSMYSGEPMETSTRKRLTIDQQLGGVCGKRIQFRFSRKMFRICLTFHFLMDLISQNI